MSSDVSYADYLEGLRSEHADGLREEMLISKSTKKQRIMNIDDYPEFHYG